MDAAIATFLATHGSALVLGLVVLAWLEVRLRPIAVTVAAHEIEQTSLIRALAARDGVRGLSPEEAAKAAQAQVPNLVPLLQQLVAAAAANGVAAQVLGPTPSGSTPTSDPGHP